MAVARVRFARDVLIFISIPQDHAFVKLTDKLAEILLPRCLAFRLSIAASFDQIGGSQMTTVFCQPRLMTSPGYTWHHDNALLFYYTKFGGKAALAARGMTNFNNGMPAFKGTVSDGQILDILAYIRSTWPARQQEAQASHNPPR